MADCCLYAPITCTGNCASMGGCGKKSVAPAKHMFTSTLVAGMDWVSLFTSALRSGKAVEMCLNSDLLPFPPLHQILLCGQLAATGSAWMDSLRRPHPPREPGRRPIPTLDTAPSLLQQAWNQAARPVGPTSQTWPGRWVWTCQPLQPQACGRSADLSVTPAALPLSLRCW